MADEDKIAPIESRAVVELVDRLRESYNEGQDDGMSEIERKWTAEDWRKWALGLVGAASTSKSARRAIEQAVREATTTQGAYRRAVEVIRTLRDYLAKPEGDGPIRYIEALALCDSILVGLPDEGGRR
jgi:hypothetical protein